jgi:hypothetical protein
MDGRARLVQRYDPVGRGPAELSVAGGLDTTRTDAVGEAARSRPTETAQRTVRLVAAGCHTNGTYAYGSVILAQSMATGAGGTWHSCSAEFFACQLAPKPIVALTLSQLHLSFLVSRDEEYVALSARAGSRTFNLGDGVYNYLLLTLARRRLADAAERLDDTACGWVSQEELDHDPTMAPTHINIGVFRMRERLRGFGVDANAIVERRRTARQLRIGTSHLSVVHV